MESPLRRHRWLPPPEECGGRRRVRADRRVPVVGRRPPGRLPRSLLAAAAAEGTGLGMAIRVVLLSPQRALVRLKLACFYSGIVFGCFVILGSDVYGRMYWMNTPDGMVYTLIGVNVAVFMLWRVADREFMKRHFMVTEVMNHGACSYIINMVT